MVDFLDREKSKKVWKSKDYTIAITLFIFGFILLIAGVIINIYLMIISLGLFIIGGYFIFNAWKEYFK
jgi:hypothetical protein